MNLMKQMIADGFVCGSMSVNNGLFAGEGEILR